MRGIIVAMLLAFTASLALAQPQPPPAPGGRPPSGARTERRVALVVGNNAYPRSPLASPVRDARDMAAVLRAAGFTLVTGGPVEDADKRSFEAAILEFGHAAEGADAAVFYYSGHGMEWDQQNWMIPVDSRGGRPEDVPLVDVSVDLVLQQITAARPHFAVIIFDACRPNLLHPRPTHAGGGGLRMMLAPENTIIAFATQPNDYSLDGGEGSNSLYTKELLAVIRTPGLELFQIFNRAALATKEATRGRQRPWTNYSPIAGEFYFFPRDGAPPPAVAASVPQQPSAAPSAGSSGARQNDPSFTLVNLSGQTIEDLRVSLSADRNWGENRVREHPMRRGERLGIELPTGGDCRAELRVVLAGGKPVTSSQDSCRLTTLVVDRGGEVAPSNADFNLVNSSGREVRGVYVSLSSDRNWGENRVRAPLRPDGKVAIRLPRGLGCTVDVRADLTGGDTLERRRINTCALEEWALQ